MRFLVSIAFAFSCAACIAQTSPYQGSEWSQLTARIGNKSVVALGEVGHGYETINAAKSMTLDFLRTRHGFETVVFESSFTGSMISYLRNDALDKKMKSFLYPFWITPPVRNALQPFLEAGQQKQERLPQIAGCDVQEDCRFTALSDYLIREGYSRATQKKLKSCDSILSLYIGTKPVRRTPLSQREYDLLSADYDAVAMELGRGYLQDLPLKILERCLQNRKWLCKYLTIADVSSRMQFRDSIMFRNVLWIKDELMGGKKLVIWSTDTHVARAGKSKPVFMGEWLSATLKNDYFAISFRKSMGMTSTRFDSVFKLRPLKKISAGEWITPCN